MFGYATDETEECMPLTIVLAHKLNAKLAELRRNGTLPWLRPDSKTQVSDDYKAGLHILHRTSVNLFKANWKKTSIYPSYYNLVLSWFCI